MSKKWIVPYSGTMEVEEDDDVHSVEEAIDYVMEVQGGNGPLDIDEAEVQEVAVKP